MRLKYLALLPLLVSCGQNENCGTIVQPPAVYDHTPTANVRIREVNYLDVASECAALGAGQDRWACNKVGGGILIILPIPDGIHISRTMESCLLHHEWGHVNGATADHTGWVRG